MIVDNLYTTLADYGSMSPKLSRAFEWLKANDLSALQPDQTVVVDDKRIFAQVQGYTTVSPDTVYFESHRLYIDIQMMVRGVETIQWAPLRALTAVRTPYDYDRDIVFFEDPAHSVPVQLTAGDFVVLFPSDGHKTRCATNGAHTQVHKIVVKVAV